MKRLITADPCFWAILDAESRVLGCSSPALIRCGTLDLIAKNNQARIPLFFKEEHELKIYSDALHRVHLLINDESEDPVLSRLLETAPDHLRQELFEAIYLLLDFERNRIFHRKRIRNDKILKP